MRRAGEIMEELGFKKDAPEGVQKAFIKNLVRAAYGAEVEVLDDYRDQKSVKSVTSLKTATKQQKEKIVSPGPNQEEQLSFQFMKKNG